MDVNVQMPKAGMPEHDNAQLPTPPVLAPRGPSPAPALTRRNPFRPPGVEMCARVTPCARVSVHEVVVVPELAVSCRTLTPL